MDSFFQRSLEDAIKGLRLCPPGTEPTFIAKSLDDIRREIKSSDRQTKAIALQKLTYLHSIHGVDLSWAAFHSVELSSSSVHSHKRIAFLSASLSFNPSSTDVILLLTHQLRKDLSSSNVHDVSLALSTLSSISNPDLCRDLRPELFTLLGSSKFFVRKKAIAVVLRLFEQYPDAVRVCFKRVVGNLESSDMGILSAAVGLFCELTVKEPKPYLPLAPEFYKILVDCRNNWVLIKVLKIFTKLVPLEPRFGKKLVEPICQHLARTGAKSLAFECVKTIVTSLSEYEPALRVATGKVREFLLDDDPNLKYLGLHALAIVAEKHIWAVLENKELVVKALSDVDPNIKLEALRLVMSIVSGDNVMEICGILINHALTSDPEFCNEILGFILLTCSRNVYEVIFDFDWYVSFLGEMARIPYCQKGREIETQLVDIGMRVKDARLELVQVARDLVLDPTLLGNPFVHGVLASAVWVSGEYVELSRDPLELMEALLQPRTSLLTPSVRSVYIQSAFKVLTFCIHSYVTFDGDDTSDPSALTESVSERDLKGSSAIVGCELLSDSELDNENVMITDGQPPSPSSRKHHLTKESIMGLINLVETNLGPSSGSDEVEVQDRASNVLGFIKLVKPTLHGCLDMSRGDMMEDKLKVSEMIKLVFDLFSDELGPVSLLAQGRVPLPDGLVLKENLSDLETICGDVKFSLSTSFSIVQPQMVEKDRAHVLDYASKEESEPSSKSTSLLAEHRTRHGLYYLPPDNKGVVVNDDPPAHEPKGKAVDAAEDLVKLTEQSLVIKNKPNRMKPRPVVVKLDEGEPSNISVEKPDLLSGAVQEVLLGNEPTISSSRKSSNKSKNDVPNTAESSQDSFAGSGRGKQHTHGKERKNRTAVKEKEEHNHKDKQKRDSRQHKRKSRRRADLALNVEVQSSIIPDFLL